MTGTPDGRSARVWVMWANASDISEVLPQVAEQAERSGLFHAEDTFWFAWNETYIQLPKVIGQGGIARELSAAVTGNWDEWRCFSRRAEVRLRKWGASTQLLMLTEEENFGTAEELAGKCGLNVSTPREYQVRPGRRVLVGSWKPVALRSGNAMARVEVRYPRSLDYEGIPGEGRRENIIVVDTFEYLDDARRLRFVRYANPRSISSAKTDICREVEVLPYEMDGRATS